jgi:hypothetical protein
MRLKFLVLVSSLALSGGALFAEEPDDPGIPRARDDLEIVERLGPDRLGEILGLLKINEPVASRLINELRTLEKEEMESLLHRPGEAEARRVIEAKKTCAGRGCLPFGNGFVARTPPRRRFLNSTYPFGARSRILLINLSPQRHC